MTATPDTSRVSRPPGSGLSVDADRVTVFRRTRFAPAPTGFLHLGHVANATWTWGIAAAAGADVVLRIEDHDRQRSRPEFEAALMDDLEWLGFRPEPISATSLRTGRPSSFRQSDAGPVYAEALARLATAVGVYPCSCSRTTFAAWEHREGRPWSGPGCPGRCRDRGIADDASTSLRAALGDGEEAWHDVLGGARRESVAAAGDVVVRDRVGNWTYPFCVAVDDLRHGVDLVVRGLDLVPDTARQVRLARLLGRATPPSFAHHPLVRRPDGRKLSKSAGDTGVRELRAAGWRPARVIGVAAAATGLADVASDLSVDDAIALVAAATAPIAPPAPVAVRG